MVPAGNVAQGSRDWPGRGATMRSPDTPSEEERTRHNLTHAPAKPWCAVRVAARGGDACHQAVTSNRGALITVIELDYGESGQAADLHNNVKMILAVDTSTGMMHALGGQIKGPGEKNGVEVMETFIQDLVTPWSFSPQTAN